MPVLAFENELEQRVEKLRVETLRSVKSRVSLVLLDHDRGALDALVRSDSRIGPRPARVRIASGVELMHVVPMVEQRITVSREIAGQAVRIVCPNGTEDVVRRSLRREVEVTVLVDENVEMRCGCSGERCRAG